MIMPLDSNIHEAMVDTTMGNDREVAAAVTAAMGVNR